jgi:hypothetical protein
MAVGGSVAPELVDNDGDGLGEAVAFVDGDGAVVARYTDLYVKDARGERLTAWMRATAGELSLQFDDAGAVYPVEIDPLIWAQQAKLTASDGAASDRFGTSVALWGDTALVGVPYDEGAANANQGSAYGVVQLQNRGEHPAGRGVCVRAERRCVEPAAKALGERRR